MDDVFLKILNMSLSACWLMAAVLVLRPLLSRFSSMLCMAAWAFAAIRLLCPFTIESGLSLIPSAEPATDLLYASSSEPLYEDYDPDAYDPAVQGLTVAPDSLASDAGDGVDSVQVVPFAAAVWLVGIGIMAAYGVIGMIGIHRRTRTAVPFGEGVWMGDDVGTPFIVGALRPRIYIPSDLSEAEKVWVIAHERSHIRWGDAVVKPLGFLVLALHWFNPLVWLCYVLFCHDMESACDERVIGGLTAEDRKAYSSTLLSCSSPRRAAFIPLAFGEIGVKQRIKNVLNFKRPALWIAITACVLLAVSIPLWFCDPLSPSPIFEIDSLLYEQIGDWVLEYHEGQYAKGEVAVEHHEILDIEKDDDRTIVYMWVLYQEYARRDGEVVDVSGAHIPTVIVAHKVDGEYRLEEYWEPEDGDRYAPSIRKRFPVHLWRKAMDSERYIDKQTADCRRQAAWQMESDGVGEWFPLYATVTEVSGTFMTVTPLDGQTIQGEVWVSSADLLDPTAVAVGDTVCIYYDGTVQETYPVQLPHVDRIEKIDINDTVSLNMPDDTVFSVKSIAQE